MRPENYFKIILISFVVLTGCTDEVNINPGSGDSQIVVEGNIIKDDDNPLKVGGDTVKLSWSAQFNEKNEPAKITDALVIVRDSLLNFDDTLTHQGNGIYLTQKITPALNGIYKLSISLPNGDKYMAETKINRAAIYRSLEFRDTNRTIGPGGPIPAGPYAVLRAFDLEGPGDKYLFTYYTKKAGELQWKQPTSEQFIVVASDWSSADNNPNVELPVAGEFDIVIRVTPNLILLDDTRTKPAWSKNDSLRIDISSITADHLFFFYRLRQELSNGASGFNALFARPYTNIPTNILNVDKTRKNGIGWFGGKYRVSKKAGVS